MPEHFLKKFYVKCSELFWKLKKKWSIKENWKLKWLGGVGWVLGVMLCCPFLRVGARGWTIISIEKISIVIYINNAWKENIKNLFI